MVLAVSTLVFTFWNVPELAVIKPPVKPNVVLIGLEPIEFIPLQSMNALGAFNEEEEYIDVVAVKVSTFTPVALSEKNLAPVEYIELNVPVLAIKSLTLNDLL